jgi:phosphoribosylglycinamide formyltransferase-1
LPSAHFSPEGDRNLQESIRVADTPQPSLISPVVTSPDPAAQPLRLGVMASGTGSNFEAIAAKIAAGELAAEIPVLIYNNPEALVRAKAEARGIPAILHNHRLSPSREALDEAIVATLREYRVDCVIMAGWMRVVTPVLLAAFPEMVLNIHPSLLPSFKGLHAVEQALAAGVKIAGCTVHRVIPAVDSGEILIQAAVPVLPGDDAASLQARIHAQEHRIYPQAIALVAQKLQCGSCG